MARLLVVCSRLLAFVTGFSRLAEGSFSDVLVVSFDGSNATSRVWLFKKDPVMGASSSGTFVITQNHTGVLDGEVGEMPVIKWPSFIKVEMPARPPALPPACMHARTHACTHIG